MYDHNQGHDHVHGHEHTHVHDHAYGHDHIHGHDHGQEQVATESQFVEQPTESSEAASAVNYNGQEYPSDSSTQGYDLNNAYDPNAYDPNTYDPNNVHDPNAAYYDPNYQYSDPNFQNTGEIVFHDPNAAATEAPSTESTVADATHDAIPSDPYATDAYEANQAILDSNLSTLGKEN